MKHLAYLNRYFVKYKWYFISGIFFVLVSNYFRVLQPQVVREALDLVVDNIAYYGLVEGFALQDRLYGQLGRTLLIFGAVVLVLALLMGAFMFFMRQTIIVMSRWVEYDLRHDIFAHYEALGQDFYKKNNTGDLMARITEDVSRVRMYAGPALMYFINLVGLFALVIYSMLSVNVELTLYALAPLPLLSVSIYYVSMVVNRKSERIQAQLSQLNIISQEVYSGIRVIKSYVQERFMGQWFEREAEEYKARTMSLVKTEAAFFPLMVLLIGASTVVTVYVGGLKVAAGTVTPGNIAEFVIYIGMLTWPVTAVGWVASIVQRAAASQKRINEFLATPPSIQNPSDAALNLRGEIRFEDVSFTYPDTGIQALRHLSFHLAPGQKLAVIGRTGSGKSTLAELLLRLYDVSEGRILIDGQDIRTLNLHELRRQIGYVPQDVFLFSDTIGNNVAFGKRAASSSEIEEFTRYASVYEDIDELPKRFDTFVGERGVTLSGGQKQRVSIARALIKRPAIVLLDDALSAVDTTTEQRIMGYLNRELAERTAIIITHRVHGLQHFDKILVLDEGRIAEQGTHEELLALRGLYHELLEQQEV